MNSICSMPPAPPPLEDVLLHDDESSDIWSVEDEKKVGLLLGAKKATPKPSTVVVGASSATKTAQRRKLLPIDIVMIVLC